MRLGLNKKGCGPIGLDLGTHSVKLIQLEQLTSGPRPSAGAEASATPDDCRLVAAATRALPEGLSPDQPGQSDDLASLIDDLVRSAPFVGRRVVSCLPADAIQYKNLRLPGMPPGEMRGAVEWEATDRLRIDLSEHRLQFVDVGEVRQGDEVRHEILLMAAPIALVNEHIQLLTSCGLEALAIDAAPGALARFVEHFDHEAEDPEAARVVLDIGYASSKVCVCRNGRIVFFKLINIGGRTFDASIAKRLKLSTADAAAARRGMGSQRATSTGSTAEGQSSADTSDPDKTQAPESSAKEGADDVDRALSEALRSDVSELAREVGLCLRYFSVTFRGARPDRIVLIGGEAAQPQLREMLADGAGVRVDALDPLAGLDPRHAEARLVKGGATTNGEPRRPGEAGQWATALGLSLRRAARRRPAARDAA